MNISYFHVSDHHNSPSYTLLDWLILPGTTISVLGPWVILFTSLTFKFDPFYFVLEDLMPVSSSRSIFLTCLNFTIRFVGLIGSFECGRVLGYFGVAFIILAYNGSIIILNVARFFIPSKQILCKYPQACVLVSCLIPPFCRMFSMTVSCLFWLLVFYWWLCIKASGKIPMLVYLSIVILSVTLLPGLVVGLRIILKFSDASSKTLQRCRMQIRITGNKKTNKESTKLDLLQLRALKPIKFLYYPFNVIDQQFECYLLQNCMLRLCDALLIF